MKLYELPSLYRRIDDMLDETGGELTAEIEALIDSADDVLESKVDAIGALIRERIACAEAERSEAHHFAERARLNAAAADRLKAYLLNALVDCGLDGARGRRFSARVQANSTPSIRWEGEGDPPEGFTRTTVALDGAAAARAYREGTLPGGFAVEVGKHLRIR